jgi:5-methylcytosine-specific restriction enzyme A
VRRAHKEYERDRSARRRKATAGAYKTKRWEMLRRRVLVEQSLCQCGEIATDVDHIVPLSQGGLPYARSNVQGLCPRCHAVKTAGENSA